MCTMSQCLNYQWSSSVSTHTLAQMTDITGEGSGLRVGLWDEKPDQQDWVVCCEIMFSLAVFAAVDCDIWTKYKHRVYVTTVTLHSSPTELYTLSTAALKLCLPRVKSPDKCSVGLHKVRFEPVPVLVKNARFSPPCQPHITFTQL